MTKTFPKGLFSFLLFLYFSSQVSANDTEITVNPSQHAIFEQCLFKAIKSADKQTTLAQIETACENNIAREILNNNSGQSIELGAMANRMIREKRTAADPYVLTPHKMNYILPFSIVDDINRAAYQGFSTWAEDLKDAEAKFQVSLKIPLLTGHWLNEGDQLFFGFTLKSWWQIYADEISKPFRETNYQPEFFYFTPINYHPWGGNSAFVVGFEHQSNGQSQLLSRGWNRVYVNYLYEKRNFAFSLRPWYRVPEGEKSSPTSGQGDDNPDILDYMGHFELAMAYKHSTDFELSFKGRDNFSTHKGFVEFGITFPLWGKLKGYAQVSSGYGESLIDYNVNQKRFGIGIALTNLL
ncbi:phospholipase A [Colwellia sp. 12G3]|uniref:phospholipase A n=1 Tax=Colwellia sp. 12G3 TaxID=2058299 RepID=UPI000C33E79E|nr:phospholipase A [Colwellia sp. 12G3]PKI16751.1 phospholipase [Colwellia sp. 12G3]